MTAKDERKVIVVGSGGCGIYSKILKACEEAGIHIIEAHTVVTPEEHVKPITIERAIRNEQKVLNPEGSKFIPNRKRKA